MLDGEPVGSRPGRSLPSNPPYPWASSCQSEWWYNHIRTSSTTREPGWSRGTKACNYHDNFFDGPSGFRSIKFLQAREIYFEGASYSNVPAADRPFVIALSNATFDYEMWCRNNTLQRNAYKTGMASGHSFDANQNNNHTSTGWFAASSFEAAFPGVTIGPAGWDHQQIRYKVGLL
jgi:hypothetical protein